MGNKNNQRKWSFRKYMKSTYMNKIISLILFILGYISMILTEDGTAFVFLLMIAIPLFFTKHNWINKD